MFDGTHHQVTHVLASDAARSGEEAHSFTITAVQCEGNPHLITVVTANLEAVGAPTPIAFIHSDATVVPPLGTTGMAIEHETVGLHHSVDSFVVGRLAPGGQRPTLEDGMDPPVAVGRQLGDGRLDLGHKLLVRQRWPAEPLLRSCLPVLPEVEARAPDVLCDGLHGEPSLGSDGGSRSCFFEPVACSSASLRISASSVFLPSSRWSSRT